MEKIESQVTFFSNGERLVGKLGVPEGLAPGERRAAFVIMHGFGGNMEDGLSLAGSRLLQQLGYVTLRFDYRGCGVSQGTRGLVLWEREVTDALSALTFLEQRPEANRQRIGLLGGSLAGAIAILAAAHDKRIAACISCGGLASGETTLRWLRSRPQIHVLPQLI
jgi:alpha/beta superfamily hydrolase